jgi:hypothetical protein
MGTYYDGILGQFRGKVGSVIGSKWKGISYMRSKGSPRSSNFSERQLEQQARFSKAIRFMQPLHSLLKIGYRSQGHNSTALNCAIRDVLRDVITGAYPDLTLNYAGFRMAKGTLSTANDPLVTPENGELVFRWSRRVDQADGKESDVALLLALGETGEPAYSLGNYTRADGAGVVRIPVVPSGTVIHCYIAMVASDSQLVSNSYYLGTVIA